MSCIGLILHVVSHVCCVANVAFVLVTCALVPTYSLLRVAFNNAVRAMVLCKGSFPKAQKISFCENSILSHRNQHQHHASFYQRRSLLFHHNGSIDRYGDRVPEFFEESRGGTGVPEAAPLPVLLSSVLFFSATAATGATTGGGELT